VCVCVCLCVSSPYEVSANRSAIDACLVCVYVCDCSMYLTRKKKEKR
jgi:hypothetical protein